MILATQEPTSVTTPNTPPVEVVQPNGGMQPKQPVAVPTEQEIKKERTLRQFEHYGAKLFYIWNRIITFGLTAYGIKGVYGAAYFVLVTNKELNDKLSMGLVSKAEVNQVSIMAAMLVLNTIIYFVLALRLNAVRQKTGPTIDLIVSMVFLVGSPILQQYVSMIDFVSLVGSLF